MLVRVLLDNNGAKVPFLTADRVCMLGRVLRDNAGGEEEVVEVVEIVEEIVVVEGVEIVE
jgi:hypothetical protein